MLAQRAREILFTWPLGRAAVQRVTRGGVRAMRVLAAVGETSAIAEIARAAVSAEPDDRFIAIEDTHALVRERATRRLLWLRVMAPAASALGLVGAAVQAGWARNPPGLLALDPDRVLGMAMSAGATCLALGIAGSTSALGGLFFLRRRALRLLEDADRVADRCRMAPADAWTQTER